MRLTLVGLVVLALSLVFASAGQGVSPSLDSITQDDGYVQVAFFVFGPPKAYEIQIASRPETEAAGGFVRENLMLARADFSRAENTLVEWTSPTPLPPGTYYVRVGVDGTSEFLQLSTVLCAVLGCVPTLPPGGKFVEWSEVGAVDVPGVFTPPSNVSPPALAVAGYATSPNHWSVRSYGGAREGGTYAVTIRVVREGTGEPIHSGRVACGATINTRKVPLQKSHFNQAWAVCVWRIPAGSTGRTMLGSIGVSDAGTSIAREFRVTIRPPRIKPDPGRS